MDKEFKILFWCIVGICVALIVASVFLVFLAPKYLIPLWIGVVGGSVTTWALLHYGDIVDFINKNQKK